MVHHGIDRVLELQNFTFDIDGNFFGQVAVGDRGSHFGYVADLGSQITRHRVDRVGQVFPGSGQSFNLGLAAELAFGADLARHSGDFRSER